MIMYTRYLMVLIVCTFIVIESFAKESCVRIIPTMFESFLNKNIRFSFHCTY